MKNKEYYFRKSMFGIRINKKLIILSITCLIFISSFTFGQNLDTLIRFRPERLKDRSANYLSCEDKLSLKYGFINRKVGDDFISRKNKELFESMNEKVDSTLERRNGKFWEQNYLNEIVNCELENYTIRKTWTPPYRKDDKILVPKIHFDSTDKATILKKSIDSIKIISAFIKSNPNLKIVIIINTSTKGKGDINLEISKKRAHNLKKKLDSMNENKCIIFGYGENVPIISEAIIEKLESKEKRDRLHEINQRIELRIIEIN